MPVLHEFFLSGGEQATEDNLIWKEILVEGESAYTPTPNGPVKKPFKVIRSGKSDLQNGIVSIEELYENFEKEPFENVGVILGNKPGGDHEDITANTTGFVRRLKLGERSDGTARLLAGFDITEPDVKGKVERGTYANCSAGILGNVINKHTGAEFNAALKHVAITNTPWRGGMQKFGESIALADDGADEISVQSYNQDYGASEDGGGDTSGEVVWEDSDNEEWTRKRVQNALNELTQSAPGVEQKTFYYVAKVARNSDKALVVQEGEGGGDTFVVPFKSENDGVTLAPGARWTQTKQVMIAASDDLTEDQLRQRVQNALGYQLRLGDDYVVESVGKEEAVVKNTVADLTYKVGWELSNQTINLDPTNEWRRTDDDNVEPLERSATETQKSTELSDQDDLSTPEGRLAAARRKRGLLTKSNNRGGQHNMAKLNFDGLNLSDEQRQALEAQIAQVELSDDERAELARRREEAKKNEVEKKIEGLTEMGLSDNPGVLKYLRRVYLSDDKEPVAVLLSDDENNVGRQEVTLSQAFDGLFALLRNQETGKIELSSQATRNEAGNAPPADTSEENKTLEQQLQEAADTLGLEVRAPVIAR